MAQAHVTSEVLSRVMSFVLGVLWLKGFLLTSVSGETVFFDKYGHCQRSWKPFDLDDDAYTLKSTGGDDAHESLNCALTFRAPSDYGVCLTFEEFEISQCEVKVEIYNSKSATGTAWKNLGCFESKPSQMCTSSRYVIVKVSKERLTQNQGYDFEINVEKRWPPQQAAVSRSLEAFFKSLSETGTDVRDWEKKHDKQTRGWDYDWGHGQDSNQGQGRGHDWDQDWDHDRGQNQGHDWGQTQGLDQKHEPGPTESAESREGNSVSGDEVLFATIGIFVGIVLGVVLLIAILAGVVLYCCYLQQRRQAGSEKEAGQGAESRGQQQNLIEPSAPPVDEEVRVIPHSQQLMSQDLPPPYVPPPPYEEECATGRSSAPPIEQEKS